MLMVQPWVLDNVFGPILASSLFDDKILFTFATIINKTQLSLGINAQVHTPKTIPSIPSWW
jgi:hypothetical protein